MSSVTAGSPFGVVVDVEDPQGNLVPAYTSQTIAAVASNPGGATLAGVLTAAPVNGVATDNDLVLNKAGSGYTLQLSSGTLPAVTTAPFTVTAAAATQLAVTTEPPNTVTAGSGFGLVVTAEDGNGNLDATYNGNVTLAIQGNPAGAALGGTVTATAVNGVATFTGLTLNALDASYTLTAAGAA